MPRRYKQGADGQPHPAFYGKLPEEFSKADTMRFMVETDLKLSGCVSADTLAALRAEGYDYKDGNLVLDTGRKNVKTDASTWQRIENVHEPIIDKDTFYKTRERMEHIKKKHLEASKPKADVPNKPDNILVYKTKCACCGGSVLIGRHHTYSEKFY